MSFMMNISNIVCILANKTILTLQIIKIFIKHYIILNLAKLLLRTFIIKKANLHNQQDIIIILLKILHALIYKP